MSLSAREKIQISRDTNFRLYLLNEQKTVKQNSAMWFIMRYTLAVVTCSEFGALLGIDGSLNELVDNKMLHLYGCHGGKARKNRNIDPFVKKIMRFGVIGEPLAVDIFFTLHFDEKLDFKSVQRGYGFYVHPTLPIAGSPDAIMINNAGECEICEVKCRWHSSRQLLLDDQIKHKDLLQIIGLLKCTGAKRCYYIQYSRMCFKVHVVEGSEIEIDKIWEKYMCPQIRLLNDLVKKHENFIMETDPHPGTPIVRPDGSMKTLRGETKQKLQSLLNSLSNKSKVL